MGENILAFTNFSGAWENVCQHPDRRVYTVKGKLAARYAPLQVRPSVLTACESVPKDPHMEKLKGEIDAVACAIVESCNLKKYDKIRQEAIEALVPLSLSFSVKVDYQKFRADASMSGSIKVKGEGVALLPDDCQPEFNFDGDENEEGGEI
ncbi:hypothetical protein [uncultured Akkermansia sp.]|nr:hypothetical protein [uncultured Akkermansia sp.]